MEKALKLVLLTALLALTFLCLREQKSIGTQLDAIHGELRSVNENLDQIQGQGHEHK